MTQAKVIHKEDGKGDEKIKTGDTSCETEGKWKQGTELLSIKMEVNSWTQREGTVAKEAEVGLIARRGGTPRDLLTF